MSTNTSHVNIEHIEVFPYTQQTTGIIKKYKHKTENEIIDENTYNNIETDEKANYKEYDYELKSPRDGRVLSEENIALLVSKITNNSSYVIDGSLTSLTEETPYIEFILEGRYFKIVKDDILTAPTEEYNGLWVKACYATDKTTPHGFKVLQGINSNGSFGGLEFSTATPTESGWFQLLDDTWEIPISAKFRINGNSIENINGGTV